MCRMIVRRAARFGSKIGLNEPFLASVAEMVIENYGEAYPELVKNRQIILDSLTREEKRFQRTVEAGLSHLNELLDEVKRPRPKTLDGKLAFDLYGTHGLPLEITRDIAVSEISRWMRPVSGKPMDEHRLVSGAGKAFGALGGEDVDIYRNLLEDLIADEKLTEAGVEYDPYNPIELSSTVLAMLKDGIPVSEVDEGDRVEVVLPKTSFYVEAGGQVSDKGSIRLRGRFGLGDRGGRTPQAGRRNGSAYRQSD